MKQKMFFGTCCSVVLVACIVAAPTFATKSDDRAVTALIEKKCTVCHSTERVYGADKTYDEWERTIKKMVRYSDQMNYLNQQEKKNIINFLVNQKRSAR
ncbi:MAG: cytochrome c [Candidatus Electrothrix sp. LOE1_4_5]|nr:cytochrome c [Candidatus Electrothrix gigas]